VPGRLRLVRRDRAAALRVLRVLAQQLLEALALLVAQIRRGVLRRLVRGFAVRTDRLRGTLVGDAPEAELRGGPHQFAGLLVRIARQIHDDVPVALRRDLGLRHTGAVDALPDDRDSLLELLGGDRRLLVYLRLE